MFWTHIYDLLLKLACMVCSVLVLLHVPFLENQSILFITVSVVLFALLYFGIFRTLSTYLYCRLTLKMNISLSQARRLNEAFSPMPFMGHTWLPMTGIAQLDQNVKYDAALQTYEKWRRQKKEATKQNIESFTKGTVKTKILSIIMYGLLIFFLVASFFNIPPAIYLSQAFCAVFHTTEYYPILNCFILMVPTLIIFKMLDRNIR